MDIKEIIKSKGFTLSEVASKMKDKQGNIGVSHASLSKMLDNNPTTNKLRANYVRLQALSVARSGTFSRMK